MSTTIDEKVVEMRFDNKHFETHTRETMSTLDKLKQKLNLSGASKGLENLNTSANKVNMSGMSNAIDSVNSKFSMLEVMGVTAMVNIANSAVEAGKRMVKALTIDPVMDGFNEYEMTLNAIQTTMAGTGKTAKEVEEQLKLLDIYADKTVYSTADMLNNLPKFTNAGVELEKATTAMIGIANATALAGGDANKASIAFYNLGQAIGTGYLTRMDYNSINNAGIATMEWKNQMVEAAIAAGTLKKAGDNLYKAGNKTMTLQQLFIDGLQYQWATTDVMMKVFQDYGDETTEIGKKSYAAAQDIKTFSMMMDSLKATAGTGWKDTWQIIFGDLDEAKEFWTDLTNFISGIITGMADIRNKFLEGALGRSFGVFFDKIKESAKIAEKAVTPIKEYAQVVDEIISGKWGNTQVRWDALTKAGYDWAHAQNLVNEKLGNSYRRATNYKQAQDKVNKSQKQATEVTADYIKELLKLSDAELKAKGYTDEQIEAFRTIEDVVKRTGIPLEEFIANIDKIDGRWLLIESFRNAGQGLVKVFEALGDAWVKIFGEPNSESLFNVIAGLYKFSNSLEMTEETADKLERTFEGVFALFDIILTLVTGPVGLAIKIVIQFLQAMRIVPKNILGMTAFFGDLIVRFRDWLNKLLDFTDIFEAMAPAIKEIGTACKNWLKSISLSPESLKFVQFLKDAKKAVVNFFNNIKNVDNIPKYILEGLVNGLKSGFHNVVEFIMYLGQEIINAFCKVLRIESPSKEFFDLGKYIIEGLFNGIKSMVSMVYNLIMTVGNKIIEIIKSMDIGSIFTLALGGGFIFGLLQIAKIFSAVAKPFEALGDVFDNAAEVLNVFKGTLRSFSLGLKAQAIKTIAVAIAILAGSLAVLSMLDVGKMWSAVGAIAVLMILLGGLVAVAGYFGGEGGDIKNMLSFGKIALALIGLASAILVIAMALKMISNIDPEKSIQTLLGFVAIIGAMFIMIKAMAGKGLHGVNLASTFLGLGVALLLMANVVKILGKMDENVIKQGGLAIVAFGGIITGLLAATKLIGKHNVDSIGKSILKIAGAILLMAFVAKILGKMNPWELLQGGIAVTAFGGIVVGLIAATKLIGMANVDSIGKAILGIGAAMLFMVLTAKIAAGMSVPDLIKGGLAVAALGGIIVGLMAATKLITDKDISKIGRTLLMISISIGLLGITAALLSLMSEDGLKKGIKAVGWLSVFMAGLIAVTKMVPQKIMGTIIALTAAIAVLVLAVAGLSMIDTGKLIGASVALGIVLGSFALVIAACKNMTSSIPTILTITAAIGLLSYALYNIAQLPAQQSIAAATALGVLMLAMSGTMAIINAMGGMAPQAMLGIVGLLALCIPLYVLAEILSKMQGIQNAAANAAILSGFILALTGVLAIISAVGMTASTSLIGIVGLLALCIPLYMLVDILSRMQGIQNATQNAVVLAGFMGALAVVQILCAAAGTIYAATGGMAALGLLGMVGIIATLYLILGALAIMSNISNAVTNLTALTTFMSVMTDMLVKLAIVGPLALIGTAAMWSLSGLMIVMGVLATGIGALMEKFPDLEKFLNKGLPVLIDLAGGIGTMIGAFVKGALTQIASSLPGIGDNLGSFMTNAEPFITGAKNIDSKMIDGVKALAEAIVVITKADILNSLTSWLTGGNSIANFGEQIGEIGSCLKDFVSNIGTFSDSQVTTVDCASRAITALANAADTIPNEGGLWSKIAGENSLATFGSQLPGIGSNLNEFVTKLGTFTDSQVTTVDCAGKAIKSLAESAKEIPNEGGLWAAIVGDNSLATFASQLPFLGYCLNGFVTNLGTFSDDQVTTIDCAGRAIKALADAANSIPNEGGLWAKIAGDNSLSTFAGHLPGLAINLKSFVNELGTFTPDQVAAVNSACNAITAIAGLGQIDIKDTGSKLEKFGKNMVTFAKKVKEFVEKIGDASAESITSAITKTKDLINMAKEVADTNVESIKTFGESLKKFAKDGVKGFVEEFSGEIPKAQAKEAVVAMIDSVIKGAEGEVPNVENVFGTIAQSALDELKTQEIKDGILQAGKDFVTGFVNGITNNAFMATNAGRSIGEAALKAAKEAIDSNSPAKESMKLGNYFGQGLVIGIKEYNSDSYKAGYNIAERARVGLSNAISSISNLVNDNMDSQPTIRPVLDLSDVESGVGALSSMFNNGPSIGVMSNLNAISSGMNNKLQNGFNNDVVSAIDKLGKSLGNVKGDTYNVNGITYDDGSNITEAVKTLVRAAKMERRV